MKTLYFLVFLAAGNVSAATITCYREMFESTEKYETTVNTETNEISLKINGIERKRFNGNEVWTRTETWGPAKTWFGSRGESNALAIVLDLPSLKCLGAEVLNEDGGVGFPTYAEKPWSSQ